MQNSSLFCNTHGSETKWVNITKTLENKGYCEEKDGGPCWIRTSDQVIMSHSSPIHNSLQTLGENDFETNNVTQNVTQNPESVNPLVLLRMMQNLPKEDLIRLLAEVIQKR